MLIRQLRKVAHPIAAIAVAGLMTAGCGDDGGDPAGPDANGNGGGNGDIDGGVEADACVPGHGQDCGEGVSPLEYPEGGEVRIEFFETEAEDEPLLNAAEAYFYENQEPESREIFGPAIELEEGHELADSTFCLDATSGTHFNIVEWEENQAIYDTRDYLDAGEWVRLEGRGDDDTSIEMTPSSADPDSEYNDARGGVSNAQGLLHDLIYLPEDKFPDVYNVTQNSWLDIEIAGSAELPELTPTNGVNFVSQTPQEEFAMYFPSRYDMLGPDPDDDALTDVFEDNYFNRGIAYIEGQDRTFHVPVRDEPDADAPATVYIAALFNQNNGVHTYCLNPNSVEERTVTVPYEVVADLPEELDENGDPTGVRRGRHSLLHISHFGFIHDERQLHVMGMACKTSYQGWCAFENAEDADGEFCPETYWDDAPASAAQKRAFQRQVSDGASAALKSTL